MTNCAGVLHGEEDGQAVEEQRERVGAVNVYQHRQLHERYLESPQAPNAPFSKGLRGIFGGMALLYQWAGKDLKHCIQLVRL